MTINLLIVIYLIAYVCSPTGRAAVLPAPKNSILDEMKRDPEICQLAAPLRESNFSKICETVKYPKTDALLNSNDSEQFLCLGLWDRMARLCYFDSRQLTTQSVLPTNLSDFDAGVRKTLPKTELDVIDFCHKWRNAYPPWYEKTKSLVMQLEKSLNDPIMCLKLCTDARSEFIPLCSSLAMMDKMSKLIGEPRAVATGKPEAPKAVVADRPALPLAVAPDSAVKVSARAPVQQQKAEDGEATDSLRKLADGQPKDAQKAFQPANKAESKEQKNQATTGEDSTKTEQTKQAHSEFKQRAENGAAIAKSPLVVAASSIPDRYKEIDEKNEAVGVEKVEQNEKLSVEKMQPAGVDSSSKKASELPALSGDTANVGQNRAVDGNDLSSVAGAAADSTKEEVISQHTQDEPEDQFAGTDSKDTIDDPLIGFDVDDNPIKLSDKKPYIPRLPGIPNEDDSHFFGYFTFFGFIFIAGYFGYHNKQKILAMVLEGRRSRGGRSRKRPSTANYRKLDCTLEEAVTSQCNSNVTHVIY